MSEVRFDRISVQDKLPEKRFSITQEQINRYAEASGDFNPLHIDEQFAKNTMFKGTIAHGLMTVAFISQVMTGWNRKGWLFGGEINISFVSPLRPNDVVTINGTVIDKDETNRTVTLELNVVNQDGIRIVAGTTGFSFAQEDAANVY